MTNREREICEKLGWLVNESGEDVTLTNTSPQGEVVGMVVKSENFVESVRDHVNQFDVEDHIMTWMKARKKGQSGIPPTRMLLDNAEIIRDMLRELVDALEEQEMDIYWDDLTEEARSRLSRMLGDNGNYDCYPLATVRRPEDDFYDDEEDEEEDDEDDEDELTVTANRHIDCMRRCRNCIYYAAGFCTLGSEDGYALIEREEDDTCAYCKRSLV